MAGNTILYLDTSEANRILNNAREQLTHKQFVKMLRMVIPEVGRGVITDTKRDVRQFYNVSSGYVGGSLKGVRTRSASDGMEVYIPVENTRIRLSSNGHLREAGTSNVKVRHNKGGAAMSTGMEITHDGFLRGRNKADGRFMQSHYHVYNQLKMKAGIVKGTEDFLPTGRKKGGHFIDGNGRLRAYTGKVEITMKPFHSAHATKKLYKSTKWRSRPATGIGVPQMPTTRSATVLQAHMIERLDNRVTHAIEVLLKGIVKA